MKFNIEIDCTPEEARRLFGLPDLEPLHDIYLDRVKELMAKGITPDMVQSMVKTWVPMGESGLGLVQSLLGQFGGGLMGGAKSTDATDDDKPAKGRKSRSEEHTSELQSLMRSSYAVFCLIKKK